LCIFFPYPNPTIKQLEAVSIRPNMVSQCIQRNSYEAVLLYRFLLLYVVIVTLPSAEMEIKKTRMCLQCAPLTNRCVIVVPCLKSWRVAGYN